VGYNYKEQFYAGDHLRFPDIPFLGSENSHSLESWKAVRDYEYISGQFLWTGIDYLGEAHGWPIHGSGAGIINLAGFPKASYYRRQSYWANAPMIYLTTARAEHNANVSLLEVKKNEWKSMYRSWNYISGEMIEIRCYTNLLSAELFCNGRSLGKQEYDDDNGYITWIVLYEAGELTVTGSSDLADGSKTAHDSIVSTGSACHIELKQWSASKVIEQDLSTMEVVADYQSDERNEFSSLKQIEVTITDGSGNWATNDSSMLYVNVSGSGKLIGLENGDLADFTEYTATYRRAHEGRLLIYITDTNSSEETIVTVSGAGFESAVMELK